MLSSLWNSVKVVGGSSLQMEIVFSPWGSTISILRRFGIYNNGELWQRKYGNSMERGLKESVAPDLRSWEFNSVGWTCRQE